MTNDRVVISILFRLLVGTVFVLAGQIKLYDSFVGYTSSELPVAGINVIPWLGAAELAIGVLVLAGIAPRVMTLVVIALLCSFVSYSGVSWGLGNVRCGCFGQVPVAPGHVFGLDLGLLALSLAALRRWSPGVSKTRDVDATPADPLPIPSRLVVSILAWIALSSQSASSMAAELSLKERFLQEFPAAHQRLREAASHAEGEARYLLTDDLANRNVNSRDDMKWGSFRFVTRNDSLRLDQILPGGGATTNVSLVLTPGFNFRVLSPNSSSAQLADVSRDIKGKLLVTQALYWRDYFPACFVVAEAPLDEWMNRRGFQLDVVEAATDDPEMVRVSYHWDGAEWFADEDSRPADYVFTGEWWLSPDEDWAVRRTAYRQSYSYQRSGKTLLALESESVVVDVQRIPDLGVVPRRVEVTKSNSASTWSDLKVTKSRICEFQNVRKSTAGDDVFTPAALGVSDPRERIGGWFIVLNVGILLLLLLAVWGAWRKYGGMGRDWRSLI